MYRYLKLFSLWLPPLLWCALIFFASSIPSLEIGKGTIWIIQRKIAHILEYAILYVLLWKAFSKTWEVENKKLLLFWTFLFTLLYAISDEIHQLYVPTRDGKVIDVLIDVIGVGLGWLVVKWKFRKKM